MEAAAQAGGRDGGEDAGDAAEVRRAKLATATNYHAPNSPSTSTVIACIQKNALEEIRVSLERFRGFDLVDIHLYSSWSGAGRQKATKKGVAIRAALLPDLIEALRAAETEARRRGLIRDADDGAPAPA